MMSKKVKIKPVMPTPPLFVKNVSKYMKHVEKELNSKKAKKNLEELSKLFIGKH